MEENKEYKIIIVDDDDFLVDMYTIKFNSVGVKAEACKSGLILLEKLRVGLKADLILLDIVMPGQDGVETLRQIRKEKLAEGTKIVMLTNQSDQKDIEDTKILGVSGYIVKSAATPSEVVTEAVRIIKNVNTS